MGDHAIATWLYTTLNNDATLTALVGNKVFDTLAPDDTPLPYVIFSMYDPEEVLGVSAQRMWANDTWIVKGVARQESYTGAPLGSIAARINQLLHGAQGTTAAGTVWSCVRTSVVRYPEIDNARQHILHLGGIYEIMAT